MAAAQTSKKTGTPEKTHEDELQEAFHKTVDEGLTRVRRSWPGLIATGLMGGIDVSLGVLGLLIVEEATGSRLLGGLGFSIGFIALTLGKSELFTENFLVPIAAYVVRKATVLDLLRLWGGTALTNLIGGWIFTWLIILGLPRVASTAVETASFYNDLGLLQSAALGVAAGAAITLMTWMERGSDSVFGKIIAAISMAFLLAAAPLVHVIVVSLEMFAAIHTGSAPFGYGEWLPVAGWATLWNMVGGILLVTVLRLVQVGTWEIRKERTRPVDAQRNE